MILRKWIYIFNTVPIKTVGFLFVSVELKKLVLKLYGKSKKGQSSQDTLKEGNIGRLTFPVFETLQNVVIKTLSSVV